MRLTAVVIEFKNCETLRLTEEEQVRDASGQSIPLRDVLKRLASGEVLFYHGVGTRVATEDVEVWEAAELGIGATFPVRSLLHLGGIAYASDIYDGPDLRVA